MASPSAQIQIGDSVWIPCRRPTARRGAMAEALWEHFDHGADIGVRCVGPSRSAAFVQAAIVLTGVVTDPDPVKDTDAVTIACTAPDDEILLIDWLNALIFEMATRKMLFGRFELRIVDHRLEATAWGEGVGVAHHRPAVEVKGATMTGLSVRQGNGDWRADCVVDV